MKYRFFLVLTLLLLSCSMALSQTAVELQGKYQKGQNEYAVTERIGMFPEFGRDGQVCHIWLFRREPGSKDSASKELSFEEFQAAVDELVPVKLRGAKREPFYPGNWATGGGAMWALFTYEKISLVYSKSFIVNWDVKRRPYTFTIKLRKPSSKKKQVAKPKPDFFDYRGTTVEEVGISWPDRVCPKP